MIGGAPRTTSSGLLSHWLARHVGDDELRAAVVRVRRAGLDRTEADAVEELHDELACGARRGNLELTVRETLETPALCF